MEIIQNILELSIDGARKTKILYQGNLSYFQLSKYLTMLIEKEILEEKIVKDNGCSFNCYKITSKGNELLQAIKNVTTIYNK